jgi:hypothetical protein
LNNTVSGKAGVPPGWVQTKAATSMFIEIYHPSFVFIRC